VKEVSLPPSPYTQPFNLICNTDDDICIAAGTETGDGLANCLNEANATGAQAFYRAARIYNSGSVSTSGDLGVGVGTPCYASDIANRLTGWVSAASSCTL
jgi:hypothetical protein